MNLPDYFPGQLIGNQQRYRLIKMLGSGGMGQVFLARDTLLGKQVALKVLRSTLSKDQACKTRFEREVSVCTALQSEHIVRIDDAGITPEGYPYFVMEFLKGETLGEHLERVQFLSITQCMSIIVQICSGLSIAHQGVRLWRNGKPTEPVKVIHRDLKPDNIFLVPTAVGHLAKILDFGIAKLTDDQADGYTGLTHTNSFIGTYEYASPEQVRGDTQIDERSDIYSLGMMLYKMLTGTDPFGLWRRNQCTVGAWALAHELTPPEPLRSHAHCQAHPQEMEDVVMRCLAKPALERFASVGDLCQALQSVPGLEYLEDSINPIATTVWPTPLLADRVNVDLGTTQRAPIPRKIPTLQIIGAGMGATLLLAGAGFGLLKSYPNYEKKEATQTEASQIPTLPSSSKIAPPTANLPQTEARMNPVTVPVPQNPTKTDKILSKTDTPPRPPNLARSPQKKISSPQIPTTRKTILAQAKKPNNPVVMAYVPQTTSNGGTRATKTRKLTPSLKVKTVTPQVKTAKRVTTNAPYDKKPPIVVVRPASTPRTPPMAKVQLPNPQPEPDPVQSKPVRKFRQILKKSIEAKLLRRLVLSRQEHDVEPSLSLPSKSEEPKQRKHRSKNRD